MKKTTYYYIFALLLAALTVCSCVQPLDPDLRAGTGANQLNLTVSCQAPSTKAYPDGETDLNENRIDHVDWFIFRDTTESLPWKSGRQTFTGKSDGTTEFSVTSLNMDAYQALYSDGKGYVLTIANYPAEEGHSVFSGRTFSEIRQMDFVTQAMEEDLGVNDRTKHFVPLANFVMSSYATAFTLVERTPVTVNAKLQRLAAKISLDISIVPYIDEIKAYISGIDTTRIEYIQTWYPDVSNIRAYMTYANKHATLTPVDTSKREAERYINDLHFFTYNTYGFIPSITTESDGSSTVTGTPFYSYPMQWETSEAHAPFIKIILPWEGRYESNTTNPGGNLGHYITHNEGGWHLGDTVVVNAHNKEGAVKTARQNFYYKISLPSAHNILHSNVWTKIKLDVAVLGGVDEEQTVEVIGRYFVVDWNDPLVEGGGDLTAGKYLSLATSRDTFYIYGGSSVTIPVLSSNNLEVVNPTATYYDYTSANPTTRSLTYSTSSSDGNNYTIAASGHSSVTLTHNLESDLRQVQGRDISVITYKFRIRHIENPITYYKDLTVIQYPSIYLETHTPGDAYVDGRKAVANQAIQTPYYQINYDNAATTIYHVHVSAFTGDSRYYTPKRQGVTPDVTYEYLITDPRVNAGWGAGDIAYYGPTATTSTTSGTPWPTATVQNMKVGSSTPNFIAPSFLVSSRWGRPGGGMNFETAQKRCATYQEAGYPAGRWRLPTEAEVYFLFTLQTRNLITTLYTTGSGTYGYWASSGYVFGRGYTGGSAPDFRTISGTEVASIRCVYDTWYWGDQPESRTTYHPGPTN
ncbi:MAG: hypothetical protein IJU08_04800 [Bacteroidales bacterium]|nr:hypothetical protein [Bacteroidales bacterium]